MDQPTPKVSDKDVERIAIRNFGKALVSKVISLLYEYGKQEWNRSGSPWVGLAILKVANGNLNEFERYTRIAIDDFRGVLAQAEYPRYSKEIGFDKASRKLKRELIAEDWAQYNEWLKRHRPNQALRTDAAEPRRGA